MAKSAGLLLLSVSPAFAISTPAPTAKDDHVQTVAYDPGNRVLLSIKAGEVTNITFDPMETIERVVAADTVPYGFYKSDKPEDAPYTNNLPIIGKKGGTGNLVVITRAAPPQDKERAYNFVVTVSENEFPQTVYQLTFTYGAAYRTPVPVDPAAPRVPTWKEKQAAQQAELAAARLRSDVAYGPQNKNYLVQGRARDIVPVKAFDNGVLTAFSYPGNMAQPAFYRVLGEQNGLLPAACGKGRMSSADLQGPEEAVNTRIVNGLVVVDHTAPHWRIRSGEAVMDVYNCGYTLPTNDTGTGTSSPDVVRRIVAR